MRHRNPTAAASQQAILFLAAAALFAGRAQTTEFDAFDRREQVRASDLIVTGRVVAVRSDWNATHSAIVTEADVAVDEVWKGLPHGDRLVVRTFGGRVGDVALEVEGAARFSGGERVVLFLKSDKGAYAPLGMRFGKYEIVGSGGASVAIGSLPPDVRGARNVVTVSEPLGSMRGEVTHLIEEGRK